MEKLLAKYRSGNVPSLIANSDGSSTGLLNEELLDIFRKGFSATYSISLCISTLLSENGQESELANRKLADILARCTFFKSLQNSKPEMKTAQTVP